MAGQWHLDADTAAAQLAWLRAAGFTAAVVYEQGDLAVLRADRPPTAGPPARSR